MKESTIEDILAKYPDLIEEGLTLQGRQVSVHGRRMDLVFRDAFGRQLIVELKAGPIKDKDIGQIMSYEGSLLSHNNPDLRIMLVGTRVPHNIGKSLDHHGIAWKEISIDSLIKHIEIMGDKEITMSAEIVRFDADLGKTPMGDLGPSFAKSTMKMLCILKVSDWDCQNIIANSGNSTQTHFKRIKSSDITQILTSISQLFGEMTIKEIFKMFPGSRDLSKVIASQLGLSVSTVNEKLSEIVCSKNRSTVLKVIQPEFGKYLDIAEACYYVRKRKEFESL
jgi:hypothetical protein